MPVLDRFSVMEPSGLRAGVVAGMVRAASLFPECGNPHCESGRFHLWRGRRTPVFEGGWNCSEECTKSRIQAAIRREMEGRTTASSVHSHRVPIGLLMLAEGWITQDQLKSAMQAQRTEGSGRLGKWLVRDAGVDEHCVTRALSMQWNCPVFTIEDIPDAQVSCVAPRLLLEAFGVLPIRIIAGKLLYVGFEDRIDRCATLAIERMTGLRVEAGLVHSAEFARIHDSLLTTSSFPRVRLIEAADSEAMATAFTSIVEKAKPAEARVVRMHDCHWLRLWYGEKSAVPHLRRENMEDVLCSFSTPQDA